MRNGFEGKEKIDKLARKEAKLQPVVILDTVHEIAIYIHSFYNLDLFQQGWYQLKVTVRWTMKNLLLPPHLQESCNMEWPSSSAVILKFELLYAPLMENGSEFQASPDSCPAAVHEFQIPSKALLGLHSYCPVYFDASHAALVDVSIHITLLEAGSIQDSMNVPKFVIDSRDGCISYTAADDVACDTIGGSTLSDPVIEQELIQADSSDLKQAMIVKALLDARETLIVTADNEVSGQGKPQNGPEKINGESDFQSAQLPQNLSKDDVTRMFNLYGDRKLFLWSTFLTFHRDNKTRIMEVLHYIWANDRKSEWSIWMVYFKVEMPHYSINEGFEETNHRVVHKRGSSLWKLFDDPVHMAEIKADLHRQSIVQMKINSLSIQDMQIFGDPSAIPIVIVERVMNAPRRSLSYNWYMNNLDVLDSVSSHDDISSEEGKKPVRAKAAKRCRDLKGHHLDFRLVRNQWLLIDSEIKFLMSEANEDKTSGDFRETGLRLAQEVVHFLKRKIGKASRYERLGEIELSFLGHSIGNIIIRAAVADSVMEPYLRYLHTYLSLSGPHLGYLYSSNSLFNSGLWLLKKFKGSQCFHQLTFTDDPDIYNTFFYKLCKVVVRWFVSRDGYIPYHSARIESCQAAATDHSKNGKAFLEMLHTCFDQMRAPTTEDWVFMRCDVHFQHICLWQELKLVHWTGCTY
ncbi:Serine esterase family protein, putative isoform 2 [Hibiscus syriacus]|uniref:Serine esterase family protein, putative isoform 2 n=1 Tax=Hibiscus syriacus TaxID=106335 RepID=A0A6A2YY89_HIBSY|nr:Serine esterase family protein, putative isoform 2 [Hibiscus syriacus]